MLATHYKPGIPNILNESKLIVFGGIVKSPRSMRRPILAASYLSAAEAAFFQCLAITLGQRHCAGQRR
jgi:hypothetical protein